MKVATGTFIRVTVYGDEPLLPAHPDHQRQLPLYVTAGRQFYGVIFMDDGVSILYTECGYAFRLDSMDCDIEEITL